MTDATLHDFDHDLRGLLTRLIAELGYAPSLGELSAAAHATEAEVEQGLLRLQAAKALLLHPNSCAPWAVHPFALSPGSCWVEVGDRGYWANCLYCAFGVAAALGADAVITTRLGGERETMTYRVEEGEPAAEYETIFHMSTPVSQWWDNVIHACASFQPFRTEANADAWCARHRFPKGAVLAIPALWRFARDWYGAYLREPWRKRSIEETRALFARHGFTSAYWAI